MESIEWNWILGWVVLLCLSAFFSGSETALFSLSRDRVIELRRGSVSVSRLLDVLDENPSGLLVAILFGNLTVNILFFSMSTVLGHQMLATWGAGGQLLIGFGALISILLVGEMVPKAIGISFPESVARSVARPLRCWFHLLGPLRLGLERVSGWMTPPHRPLDLHPDELKLLIDSTVGGQGFGRQEKAIVEEIINLPEARVRALMVPRVEQTFWNGNWSVEKALAFMIEHPLEVVPVYMHQEEQLVGYVEASVLFAEKREERALIELVEPLIFVPETMRADRMLEQFMDQSVRMAAVVDEYGGLAGTLTVEDLLQEVVGEFDAQEMPAVEALGESVYRLEGRLSVREWRDLFIGFIPVQAVDELALDTVSGLVISLLKRIPHVGDRARLGNLCFTVEQVRSNRIESVLLELDVKEDESK
ncbi:MAG: hemolysin family protein [Pontiellaceae bacterium]